MYVSKNNNKAKFPLSLEIRIELALQHLWKVPEKLHVELAPDQLAQIFFRTLAASSREIRGMFFDYVKNLANRNEPEPQILREP